MNFCLNTAFAVKVLIMQCQLFSFLTWLFSSFTSKLWAETPVSEETRLAVGDRNFSLVHLHVLICFDRNMLTCPQPGPEAAWSGTDTWTGGCWRDLSCCVVWLWPFSGFYHPAHQRHRSVNEADIHREISQGNTWNRIVCFAITDWRHDQINTCWELGQNL